MTDDERQEAERVWDAVARAFADNGWDKRHDGAIEVIAAARKRWQNEALEEAAGKADAVWCHILAKKIRALKK